MEEVREAMECREEKRSRGARKGKLVESDIYRR